MWGEDDCEDISPEEEAQQSGNRTAKVASPRSQGRRTPTPQKVTGRPGGTKGRGYWVKYREGQIKGRTRDLTRGADGHRDPKSTKETRVKSRQDEAGPLIQLKAEDTGATDCGKGRV